MNLGTKCLFFGLHPYEFLSMVVRLLDGVGPTVQVLSKIRRLR